jgi:hypothetical protein
MTRAAEPCVKLSAYEWSCVLFCLQSFDFNPDDPRPAALVAAVERQTGVKPLPKEHP